MTTSRVFRALSFVALITFTAITISPATGQAPPKSSPTVQTPKSTPAVAVAMFVDEGVSGKGPAMLEETFTATSDFRITRLKASDVRAGKLKDFRVLIVPGGSGKREATTLGKDGRAAVKTFVSDGGTFVGICAGCFLASTGYDWSLDLIPARTVDRANYARGGGELKLEMTAEGKTWTGRTDAALRCIYHNGPVLEPVPDAKEKLIPLAYFREELVKAGAKAGLMVNTPAVAAARYGKGWAVGVSPHPEQTEGLKDLVPASIRWALAHPEGK